MSNAVQLWNMPNADGVEFVFVQGLMAPIPCQVCSAYKLVYFERGAKQFRYRRSRNRAGTGDLLLIPSTRAGRSCGITFAGEPN